MIINVLYYLLRYEPNTPLALRRRDTCHSKQQAGHIKIVVGSGQDTENPILWCGRLYFGIVLTEKSVTAFNQVVLSKNCCFRSESASKIPPQQKIIIKAYAIIRQDIVHLHVLTVGYDVDFVSPIFGTGLSSL